MLTLLHNSPSLLPPKHTQNPESGGSGGSRFSLKTMAVRLRGRDTSYEARLSKEVRELQEAEDAMKQAQQELE